MRPLRPADSGLERTQAIRKSGEPLFFATRHCFADQFEVLTLQKGLDGEIEGRNVPMAGPHDS